MNLHISTTGWIVLVALALFIVLLNLGLFSGIKSKKSRKSGLVDKLNLSGEVLKDPFKKEDEKYRQLSEEVAKIKSQKQDDNSTEK